MASLRGPHRKPTIRFLPARLLLSTGLIFFYPPVSRNAVLKSLSTSILNSFSSNHVYGVAGKDSEIFFKEFLDGFCFRRRLDYDKVFLHKFLFLVTPATEFARKSRKKDSSHLII